MKIQNLMEAKLVEAFSPSMPNWLKTRIQFDLTRSYIRDPNRHSHRDFNKEWSKIRDIAKADGGQLVNANSNARNLNGDSTYNLYTALLTNNVDLNKAKFISGDIPKNGFDERVRTPNIPFFHLRGGYNDTIDEVYAKGLTDNLDSQIFNTQFKNVPVKKLVEKCVDFCYLDLSDPENLSNDFDKRMNRIKTAKEMDKSQIRGAAGAIDPNDIEHWRDRDKARLDKSGYSKLPNIQKYKKLLRGSQDKRVLKKLEAVWEDANYLYSKIPSIFDDMDIQTAYRASDSLRSCLSNLENVATYYRSCLDYLDNVKTAKESGKDYESYLSYAESYLNSANSYLEDAKNTIAPWIPATVDWDTDDIQWEE